uniref:Uncharacterized protein n=1 Tax=Pseudoalteromonas luteoviolacea TaxID=43657 RepID=A0A023PZN8_9GAMM|nr:hypothetical protein [Pseudoalteromonas luteoviolacea]
MRFTHHRRFVSFFPHWHKQTPLDNKLRLLKLEKAQNRLMPQLKIKHTIFCSLFIHNVFYL